MFYKIITSRANQTNTLDGYPRKQKTCRNKSTHYNVTGKIAQKKSWWTKISKIQDNVECYWEERDREIVRESEERMFVCDNILNKKKRESKDLSLTDKNTRENKNQLEINTLEAYDEGC